jgi:hypothetical protein
MGTPAIAVSNPETAQGHLFIKDAMRTHRGAEKSDEITMILDKYMEK